MTGPGDQINTDPLLGPLQDNGGPTFTHALLPGSPAIDTGDPNFTPPPFYDQRGPGFDRIANGRIDVGSFEVQGPNDLLLRRGLHPHRGIDLHRSRASSRRANWNCWGEELASSSPCASASDSGSALPALSASGRASGVLCPRCGFAEHPWGSIVFEHIRDIRVIRGLQVFCTFRVTNRQILRSTSVNGQK